MDGINSSPTSTSSMRHSNITNFPSLTRMEIRQKNEYNGDIEAEISSRNSFESGISNDSDSTTMNGYDHLYAAGTFDESQAHYSVNDVGPNTNRYSNEKEGECEEKIVSILKKVNSSSMNEPLSPILVQNKPRFSKQADILIRSLLSMPSHDDEVYIVEGYGSSSEEELDSNIDSGLSFDKENIERELNSICGQDLYSDSAEDDYEKASCRDKNEKKCLEINLVDNISVDSLLDRRYRVSSSIKAPRDKLHQKEEVNPLGNNFETILESRDETNSEIAAKRNINCVTLQERDEAIEVMEEELIVSNGVHFESSPSHSHEAINLPTNAQNSKSSSKKQKFHFRAASNKYSNIVEQPLLKKSPYCRKSRSQYKLNPRTPIVKRLMKKAIRSPFFGNGHDLRQMKYQIYTDTFDSERGHSEINTSRDSDSLSRSNQNVSLPIAKAPSTPVETTITDSQFASDPNMKDDLVQEASILSSDVRIDQLGHNGEGDAQTKGTFSSLDCYRRSSGNLDHQNEGLNSVPHVKKNKYDWLDPINNCQILCQDKLVDEKHQGEWGNMKEREVNSNIAAPAKLNRRESLGSDSTSICPSKPVTNIRDHSIRKLQLFHSEIETSFEEISSTRSPSGLKPTEKPKTHDSVVKDNNLPTSRKHIRGVTRGHIDNNAISNTSSKVDINALSIDSEYLHGLELEVIADANIFRTKGCLESRNSCGLSAGGAGVSTIRVPPKYISSDLKVNSSSVASVEVGILRDGQKEGSGCKSSHLNPTNNLNSCLISGYLNNGLGEDSTRTSGGVCKEEEGIELCLDDEKNSRKRYFDKTSKDKSCNPQTTIFLSIGEDGHNKDCKTEPNTCLLTKPRVRVGRNASHINASHIEAGENLRMDQLAALQKMSNGDNDGDSVNSTSSTQKQKIDDFWNNRSVDTMIEINAQNNCLGERADPPQSYDRLANRTGKIAPKEVNIYDESHIPLENDFKNPRKSTENAIFLRRQQYRGNFSQNYYIHPDKMKVDTSIQSSLGTPNKTIKCRQSARSWPVSGSKRLSSSLTSYSSYLDTTNARCNSRYHKEEGVAIVCTPDKSIDDKARAKKSPRDIIQQIISGRYSKFEHKSSRVATKKVNKLGSEDMLVLDIPAAAPLVNACRKGHPNVSEQNPENGLKKESSADTIKIDVFDNDNNLINASPKIHKSVKDRINYFNLSDKKNLAPNSNDLQQRFPKAVTNRETRVEGEVKGQRNVELLNDGPKVSGMSGPKVQHIGKSYSPVPTDDYLIESVMEESENASIKRQNIANSSKTGTGNIRVKNSHENGMLPSNGLVLPDNTFCSYKSKTKKDTEELEKQSDNELINASPKIQTSIKDRINFLNLSDKTNLAPFSNDLQQSSKAFLKRDTRVGGDAKGQRIVEVPKVSGISGPKVQHIGKSCSPVLTHDYLIGSMLPSVDNAVDKIEDASSDRQDTKSDAIEVSTNTDISRSKALQFWTRAKHEAQESCI